MNQVFLPIILFIIVVNPLEQGKCIAGAYANQIDIDKLDLDCFYTWSPGRPSWADDRWIPMIRDVDDAVDILNDTRTLDHNGTVMLFNECDAPLGSGQCEATPLEAANLTRALQNKFPEVDYWVSPAVHNLGWSGWLEEYLDHCSDCQIDVIAIHWYDLHNCTMREFTNYVESFQGRPIWITEIACLDPDQNLRMMQQYWQYSKDNPEVLAFFPWSLKIGPLYGDLFWVDYVDIYSGELTPLGQWYKDQLWQ